MGGGVGLLGVILDIIGQALVLFYFTSIYILLNIMPLNYKVFYRKRESGSLVRSRLPREASERREE